MAKWVDAWVGGRIREDRRGRKIYVLRRMVDGDAYELTLGVISADQAMAELALFERDPAAYAAQRSGAPGDAVAITSERVAGFLASLEADGCTEDYRKDCQRYLVAWTSELAGADLRTVKLKELQRALGEMEGARAQRIAALKSFTRYLRDQGELEAAADLMLHAPQPRPEKQVRKKGYEPRVVELVYRTLERQEVRDVVLIRAKAGHHHTEIDRVAQGKGVLRRLDDQGEIAGTVALPHKSGDIHIQSLDAQTLAAYERLQARRSAPDDRWVARQCQLAVDALVASKVLDAGTAFNPGELRHTFATLARSAGREVKPKSGGLPMEVVSAAMGHRSTRTTRRHYDMSEIPPLVVVPLHLVHPQDPSRIEPAASSG